MQAPRDEDLIAASEGLLSHMVAPLISIMGLNGESSQPLAVLDNACGTAVLTQELQKLLPREFLGKSSFLCADNAQSAVDLVQWRIRKEGWINIEAKQLNAMETGLSADLFTHVGLGMALHIIPDPDAVLADVKKILKPGGVFGASLPHRDSTFWIPDLRSAFASFPFPAPFPAEVPMQLHDQGDWTNPEWVHTHLKAQGFSDVVVHAQKGIHHVKDADDFIRTFGMMLSWFLTLWWDEDTRKAHSVEEVKELTKKHLAEKYQGEPWDLEWMLIYAAGRLTE